MKDHKKPVIKVNQDRSTIARYESITSATKSNGIPVSRLQQQLKCAIPCGFEYENPTEANKSRLPKTFEGLAARVRSWAHDRQILQNSTAGAQLEKLEEERQETLTALTALRFSAYDEDGVGYEDAQIDLRDGFGDMLVCIINAAAIAGVDPVEALAHAYDEIKDRRGYLNSDGIFVKEEQARQELGL